MTHNPFSSRFLTDIELSALGFKRLGRDVAIHEKANVVGLHHIAIGSHVRIDPFVSLIATGPLTLGSYIHIGAYSYLSAAEGIVLDDFCNLSQGVKIYTRSDDYSGASLTNPTVPDRYKNVEKGPVRLGRHVIIGSGSVVLPGCVLEDGVAVGALSLVRKSLAGWGLYAGIPARYLRPRQKDLLALEKQLLDETGESGTP